MSYGLLARCSRTGRLGYAVASQTMASGSFCFDGARSGTGVSMTLGAPRPANNLLAMKLLAQGFTAMQTLKALQANDAHAEFRQIAVMDRDGNAAVATGPSTGKWAGQQ